jgi:hypothetical protein
VGTQIAGAAFGKRTLVCGIGEDGAQLYISAFGPVIDEKVARMPFLHIPAGSAVRVHIQYDYLNGKRRVAHQGNVVVDEDFITAFEANFQACTGLDPGMLADMVHERLGGCNGTVFAATALPVDADGRCLLRAEGDDIVLTAPGEQALSSMRHAFKAFMPPTDALDLWPDARRACDAGFAGTKLSMPIFVQGAALDTRDTLFHRLSQQPGFEQAPASYTSVAGADMLTVVVAFVPDGVGKLVGGFQRFTSLHALDSDFVRSSPLLQTAQAKCVQLSLSSAISPMWTLLLREFGNGGDDISLLGGAAPLTKAEFNRHARFTKMCCSSWRR